MAIRGLKKLTDRDVDENGRPLFYGGFGTYKRHPLPDSGWRYIVRGEMPEDDDTEGWRAVLSLKLCCHQFEKEFRKRFAREIAEARRKVGVRIGDPLATSDEYLREGLR
jgi:hypothetical protein